MAIPAKIFAPKDPSGVNIYRLDWAAWLLKHASDTISTSSWSVPAGITQDSAANTTTTATITLSGGSAGTNYDLTNTIATAGGLTECRTIRIPVADR